MSSAPGASTVTCGRSRPTRSEPRRATARRELLHQSRGVPAPRSGDRAEGPSGTLCRMPAPAGFEKFLRFGEGRRMKRLQEQAAYITSLEPEFQALSDDELRAKTTEFRERLDNGEDLNELLFEAYAAVREARLRE